MIPPVTAAIVRHPPVPGHPRRVLPASASSLSAQSGGAGHRGADNRPPAPSPEPTILHRGAQRGPVFIPLRPPRPVCACGYTARIGSLCPACAVQLACGVAVPAFLAAAWWAGRWS